MVIEPEWIDRVRAAGERGVREEVIAAPQSSLNGPMSGMRHFATVRNYSGGGHSGSEVTASAVRRLA